jgi:hypothetical protein
VGGKFQELSHSSGRVWGEFPQDWSRTGFVIFRTGPFYEPDLWALPFDGETEGQPFAVTETPHAEMNARFSPDGRWIAYQSDETGRPEIYVQEFVPPPARPKGGKVRISRGGGSRPVWRGNGAELYFYNDGYIMAVPIRLGEMVEAGEPQRLFAVKPPTARVPGAFYDAAPDGKRFVVLILEETEAPPVSVLLNWQAVLKR